MKNALRFSLTIAMVFLVFILGFLVWGNYNVGKPDETAAPTAPIDFRPIQTPDTGIEQPADPANLKKITLAVAGDIDIHSGLNVEAYNGESYDYMTVMGGAKNYIEAADFAVGCLETTFPGGEYSGYPMFKSPDGVAEGLSKMGFDLISTASNHAMDGQFEGLKRTLDVLDYYEMLHVGTYRTQAERDFNNGIIIAEIGDVSIAFLAYTYGTNSMSIAGFDYAVNVFCRDYLQNTTRDIDYDKISADMSVARSLGTDLIAVFMHWGQEYEISPIKQQEDLAAFLFEEGADLILGGHPHVPEPFETREITDRDGNKKTGLLVYCMGNFVSCITNREASRYSHLTAVLNVEIEKNVENGKTYITGLSYVPLFMVDLHEFGVTSASWRYRLWDLHAAINTYNSGDNMGVINDELHSALLEGLDDLHTIFGSEYDWHLINSPAGDGGGAEE